MFLTAWMFLTGTFALALTMPGAALAGLLVGRGVTCDLVLGIGTRVTSGYAGRLARSDLGAVDLVVVYLGVVGCVLVVGVTSIVVVWFIANLVMLSATKVELRRGRSYFSRSTPELYTNWEGHEPGG